MKTIRNFFAVLAIVSTSALPPLTAATIVGSGPDSALFVIEATAFGGPLSYEFRFDATANPNTDSYTGWAAIDLADDALSISFSNFGSPSEPNYFINAITYLGLTLTNTAAVPFEPLWSQSVSGGRSGYPTANPITAGTWQEGSGFSAPSRYLADGSSDGLVYGSFGDVPTVAPIPEPGTLALLTFAGLATTLVLLRRRRVA